MGVLVDSDKVKCAASKLGCLILKTPFSYLGSKVGGSMSRVHIWNEVVDRVKNRLSKWKMKTLSIEEKGGLGVSSLYALNRGLMFKWMWRFYTQNTSLWVRVIKAIHGDDGKVGGYVKDGAISCWLSIVNEIKSLKNKCINLLDFMHVNWGMVIKQLFRRIFGLKTSLDSSFRRVPRGGVEQEQFDVLSALVHDVTLTPMSHIWIWALESSRDFSVASVRKVKTYSLPTRFNVSRRGIHIDSIMCAICDKGAETSSHLFFSCCMARQIVRMITR
nr:RNA-directed DNA polymerase, eukaryota, reverse transcriptase zinc-binding domain protein [Tanacetum cinerariifolium]